MGRIKTALIKSKATLIYNKNKEKFNNDFELNKQAVMKVAKIESKKMRNVLAGYITRLVKRGD